MLTDEGPRVRDGEWASPAPRDREVARVTTLLQECLTRLRYAGVDHHAFVTLIEHRLREGNP
jgi:hypothetical protein